MTGGAARWPSWVSEKELEKPMGGTPLMPGGEVQDLAGLLV